ncbi:cardiomyopathy-associated protein 5 [Tenrec ecaudatus]|uniref:cardiomyopathy-associated protein 5 n=1 Tax=Tenrec ecaudatus TaxID=94439 RepID=UPI003F5A68BE
MASSDGSRAAESYGWDADETREVEMEEQSETEDDETEEEPDARLSDQDEESKIKQECLISDPSFSMVTTQREDSGITWETNSSRSSTPWNSEESQTSGVCSLEGSTVSSPPGNVSFIVDEVKKSRRRTQKSKHGSPSLRRKGKKKRPSLGSQDVPANKKDGPLSSETQVPNTEQEKPSVGVYDKTRTKKAASHMPPITGAIYKEHKPLVLKPVYIGTVEYKIKMFNSVKEELIPLQFYGTLPKGYVIKEIHYRKGKDASISLEPDFGNRDSNVGSRAGKFLTESSEEKELAPPWRGALSRGSKFFTSGSSPEDQKKVHVDSPLPVASAAKRTVSSFSRNDKAEQEIQLPSPRPRTQQAGDEAKPHEIESSSYIPDTSATMSLETPQEDVEPDSQVTTNSEKDASVSPSLVDEVTQEEVYPSENSISLEAEKDSPETGPPGLVASIQEGLGIEKDQRDLTSLEGEEPAFEQLTFPPGIKEDMEENLCEPGSSLPDMLVPGEPEKELETALPVTAAPEPEGWNFVEEEIIELDYPESPFVSEQSFPPRLAPEVGQEEEEPILLLGTTSVVSSEEEQGENESVSTDSAFVSEYSVPQDLNHEPARTDIDIELESPGLVQGTAERAVLSDEGSEDWEPSSPAEASVSEPPLTPLATERSSAWQATPSSRAPSELEPMALPGAAASEGQDSTPEPPVPAPKESQKKAIDLKSALKSKGLPEHMILPEEEEANTGLHFPEGVSGSEQSLPTSTTEATSECPSPLPATTPSQHVAPSEEETVEIPAFTLASEFSVSPHVTEASQKENNVCGSPLSLKGAGPPTNLPEEQEDIGPFSPDSAFASEFSFSPDAALEAEKREFERDSPIYLTSPSDHTMLSDEDTEETELFSPDSASQVSIPPYRVPETKGSEAESDSSLTTVSALGTSHFPEADEEEFGSTASTPVPDLTLSPDRSDVPSPVLSAPEGVRQPPLVNRAEKAEIEQEAQTVSTSVSEFLILAQNQKIQATFTPESEDLMPPHLTDELEMREIQTRAPVTTAPVSVPVKPPMVKEEDKTAQRAPGSPDSVRVIQKGQEPEASVVPKAPTEQMALSKVRKEETVPGSQAATEHGKGMEPRAPTVPESHTKPPAVPELVHEPKMDAKLSAAPSETAELELRMSSKNEPEVIKAQSPLKEASLSGPEVSSAVKTEVKHESQTTGVPRASSSGVEKEVGHDPPALAFSASPEEMKQEVGSGPSEITPVTPPDSSLVKAEKEEIPSVSPLSIPVEQAVLTKVGKGVLEIGLPPSVTSIDTHSIPKEEENVAAKGVSSPTEATAPKWRSEAEKGIQFDSPASVSSLSEHSVSSKVEREEVKPELPITETSPSVQSEVSKEAQVEKEPGLPCSTVLNAEQLTVAQKKNSSSSSEKPGPELLLPPQLGGERKERETEVPSLQSESPASKQTLPTETTEELPGSPPRLENLVAEDSIPTSAAMPEIAKTSSGLEEASQSQEIKPVSLKGVSLGSKEASTSLLEGEQRGKWQPSTITLEGLSEEVNSSTSSEKEGKQETGTSPSPENLKSQRTGNILGKQSEETGHEPLSLAEPPMSPSSDLPEEQKKPGKTLLSEKTVKLSEVSNTFADKQVLVSKQLSSMKENVPLEESESLVATELTAVKEEKMTEPRVPPMGENWALEKPERVLASQQEERTLGSGQQRGSSVGSDLMAGQLPPALSDQEHPSEVRKQVLPHAAAESHLMFQESASTPECSSANVETWSTKAYQFEESKLTQEAKSIIPAGNVERNLAEGKQSHSPVQRESSLLEKASTEFSRPSNQNSQEEIKLPPESISQKPVSALSTGAVEAETIPSSTKAAPFPAADAKPPPSVEKEAQMTTAPLPGEKPLEKSYRVPSEVADAKPPPSVEKEAQMTTAPLPGEKPLEKSYRVPSEVADAKPPPSVEKEAQMTTAPLPGEKPLEKSYRVPSEVADAKPPSVEKEAQMTTAPLPGEKPLEKSYRVPSGVADAKPPPSVEKEAQMTTAPLPGEKPLEKSYRVPSEVADAKLPPSVEKEAQMTTAPLPGEKPLEKSYRVPSGVADAKLPPSVEKEAQMTTAPLPGEKPLEKSYRVPSGVADAAAPAMKITTQRKPLSTIPAPEAPRPTEAPEETQRLPEPPKAAEPVLPEEKGKKGISSLKSWMSNLFFGSSTSDNKVAKKEDIEVQPNQSAEKAGPETESEGAILATPDGLRASEKRVGHPSPETNLEFTEQPRVSFEKTKEGHEFKANPPFLPNVESQQLNSNAEACSEDFGKKEALDSVEKIELNPEAASAGGEEHLGVHPCSFTDENSAAREATHVVPLQVTERKGAQKPAIAPPSTWKVSILKEEPRSDQKEKSLFSFDAVEKTLPPPTSASSDFTSKTITQDPEKSASRILPVEESKGSLLDVGEDRHKEERPTSTSLNISEEKTKVDSVHRTEEKDNSERRLHPLAEKKALAEKQGKPAPPELEDDDETQKPQVTLDSRPITGEVFKAAVLPQVCRNEDHQERSKVMAGSEHERGAERGKHSPVFAGQLKRLEMQSPANAARSVPEESELPVGRALGEATGTHPSVKPKPPAFASKHHLEEEEEGHRNEPRSESSNYTQFILSASTAKTDQTALPGETARDPEDTYAQEEFTVTSKPAGLSEDQKSAFNIISEGCEILNIHAPAFIPSADQEDSEHMPAAVEDLDEKASPNTKPFHEDSETVAHQDILKSQLEESSGKETALKENKPKEAFKTEEEISTDSRNDDLTFIQSTIPSEEDYFEKYTLIDYNISPDPEKQKFPQKLYFEEEFTQEVPEEMLSFPESPRESVLEHEYDLVKLDESFYGPEKDQSRLSQSETPTSLVIQKSPDRDDAKGRQRDVDSKAPGMPLFEAEEAVLSRSQAFPATVKLINPEHLEEVPALAFLYKDLYEEAVEEKQKEEETVSEDDSVNSEASFPGRHSDTDDGTGIYFEKYILKDDILHDTSVTPKDEGLGLGEEPVGKDDSYQPVAAEEEIWGRLGTILERNLDEAQQAVCREGGSVVPVETLDVVGLQRKVPVREEVSVVTQRISYAVPFEDTHNVLERVDETSSEGNAAGGATPEVNLNVPVQVSFPEEEFASGATYVQETLQEEPQMVSSEPREHRLRNSPVQDDYEFAESLNYEVVTEDIFSDELCLDSTPEVGLARGEQFFEPISESEFVREVEQGTSAAQKEMGREKMEEDQSSSEVVSEKAQKEPQKAQIDSYCYTCKSPISATDKMSGTHKDHEVSTLDTAIGAVKVQLAEFLENLQEKSLRIEAFVSEIESFFNTIEENCSKNEKRLEEQNEEMMKKVLAQYDEKAQSFEEVKKKKMEFLHDQMVHFLQSMDTAKDTLETIVREAEELDETVFLSSFEEINDRLLSAMESTASLENIPAAFSRFEHYEDSAARSDQMLKQVAVPQPPRLEPQEPNSATSTTIAVYWSVNKEDVIDAFQVYCMEEPQEEQEANELVEEYRVTVKESYCIFEDLEPDRSYQVWVMAVNFTGCSLPSERAIFRTAPSTPVIRTEDCTVCWNTATVRWRPATPDATETYTLEYCRQRSPEGEGLRSFSGIKGLQLKVNLQPNDNYFFYVRAINTFGTSEQSEAALISTRGTRFLLLRDTAHPALHISPSGTVISLAERRRLMEVPSVLGEELPACGQHYWETTVTDCPAYRLGICSSSAVQAGAAAQGETSWYMHCSEPQRYTFFYSGIVSNVHVTERPARVGILLDYKNQRLLFLNAESGQLLFTIRHRFNEGLHPAFALEKPGKCTLHLGVEPPDSARHK